MGYVLKKLFSHVTTHVYHVPLKKTWADNPIMLHISNAKYKYFPLHLSPRSQYIDNLHELENKITENFIS